MRNLEQMKISRIVPSAAPAFPVSSAFFIAVVCVANGCAFSGKKEDSSTAERENSSAVSRLIPYTLRLRRPPSASVDPRVGPGGEDYVSYPLPDAKLDCETPSSLVRGLSLSALQECLKKDTATVFYYRLKRVDQPLLELDDPDDAPECIRNLLPTIPVPREIFYQAPTATGGIQCYSSRLDVEANQTFGLRLPTHALAVRVELPLYSVPETADEMTMLILAWSLSPFWEGKPPVLPARAVPDNVCRVCLGEKTMVKPNGPPPTLWP
jgi:hypothetical protein